MGDHDTISEDGETQRADIAMDVDASIDESERYEIVGLLGRGGMGEVKLAEDKRIGRRVALKMMRTDREPSQTSFTREVVLQGQLEHPAIVPVYDLGTGTDGGTYFTMKCVQGMTLQGILRELRTAGTTARERYPTSRLLTFFASIAQAIAFAHSRGVLHRDLKPDNIMIGAFGEVYVLDWGIAEVAVLAPSADGAPAAAHAAPSPTAGTPGFLAPELLHDKPATPASDVYALGAILFEILTLELLNPGPNAAARITATIADDADARSTERLAQAGVAPELAAICTRATKQAVAERYGTVPELHDALQGYLEGDRDLELRRAMAVTHMQRCQSLVDTDRRTAFRELGRALSLDPDNVKALKLLVDLLATPPRDIPPDVEAELEAEARRDESRGSRAGRRANLAFALPVVLALAMGVKSLAPLLVHVGAVLLATLLSGRSHAASPGVIRARRLINLVVLLVGVAVLSRMFGALIMVPSLAASVAIPFGYHASRRERLLVVVPAALATVAVPMILEMIGILDPTYVTNAAGEIMIVSHVADLSSGLSIPSMLLASLSGLAIALVLIGQMADRLRAARRRLLVQRWQLRQFLPDEPGLPATVKREI